MKKNRPSRTAYKVALNILTLGADPALKRVLPPGIVQATRRLLLASGVARAWAVKLAQSRRAVSFYEAVDWMLPGQFVAMAHRKAFFEDQVRDGLGAGAGRILILGAGYDTLGWRLAPEFPDMDFYEMDHPGTSALKSKGIKEMGPRENLHLLAGDLGERKLVDVIRSNPQWGQGAKTIVIAEGLVMYLSPDAVRDLFGQCARICGDGSRIAFSYIPSGADGRPDAGPYTRLMLRLQKLLGEPWLWSIRPEELGPFLKETGWTIVPGPMRTNIKYGVEYYVMAEK